MIIIFVFGLYAVMFAILIWTSVDNSRTLEAMRKDKHPDYFRWMMNPLDAHLTAPIKKGDNHAI